MSQDNTVGLQVSYRFRSPMQYLPPFEGIGLLHSLSAILIPRPQDLEHSLSAPHLPQPPFTADGREPISTHFLLMHHYRNNYVKKKKKMKMRATVSSSSLDPLRIEVTKNKTLIMRTKKYDKPFSRHILYRQQVDRL